MTENVSSRLNADHKILSKLQRDADKLQDLKTVPYQQQ